MLKLFSQKQSKVFVKYSLILLLFLQACSSNKSITAIKNPIVTTSVNSLQCYIDPKCEINQQHLELYTEIQSKYRDSFNLYFIISQKNVSFEEISKFIMENKLEKWSILFDKSNIFAESNNVKVLPTVFLLNHKNEILYSGALQKESAVNITSKDKYLLQSIEQFLMNKKANKKYHQAFGCSLK